MNTAGWKIEALLSLQMLVAGGMLATIIVTLGRIAAETMAKA